MATHLVLLGSPRELHIPYFAMGVRWLREDRVERLDLGTDLTRLVGRRCAAWINARAEGAKIELITTRNYLPPQTTFLATWLLFREQAVAAEFLEAYPQHRLDSRLTKIEADRQALAAKVQHRLKRGDFNLGQVGDERQRANLARKYVEAAGGSTGVRLRTEAAGACEGACAGVAGAALKVGEVATSSQQGGPPFASIRYTCRRERVLNGGRAL